ncbi:MAG: hypothetical protein LBH04_11070 [Tannerellaceae bacterium]|nr:hypothetical protein [Tannerellaceae bacterium]
MNKDNFLAEIKLFISIFRTPPKSSRRNGTNSRFDLSHHRTCRPAYGGSLINL